MLANGCILHTQSASSDTCTKKKKKNNFTSFGQPTILIAYASDVICS